MDIQFFIETLKSVLKPWDWVGILIVIVATAKVKELFPKKMRRTSAFLVGGFVAVVWVISGKIPLTDLPTYALIYGAIAAFVRDLWRKDMAK